MAVIWSGITEEGAVVPVQVTNEGKVVATSEPGDEYMPKTGGNFTGDVSIGQDPNDPDVNFSLNPQENTIRGKTIFGEFDEDDPSKFGARFTRSGRFSIQRAKSSAPTSVIFYTVYGTEVTISFAADGAVEFASGKCGFTENGELFFTSRNSLYKLLVQGELCYAEPYVRRSMDID